MGALPDGERLDTRAGEPRLGYRGDARQVHAEGGEDLLRGYAIREAVSRLLWRFVRTRFASRLAGYEPLRAWEGVTNERYLRMLFELIDRCGAGLADLSAPQGSRTPNLNVIHEIGLNMGAANVTYLIRQPGRLSLPSNFIGLPMITYYPQSPDWPEGQAKQLSRVLREIVKRTTPP